MIFFQNQFHQAIHIGRHFDHEVAVRFALVQASGLFQKVVILINFSCQVVIKVLPEEPENRGFANALIVQYAGDFSFDVFFSLQAAIL